jgi:hypothetical protein
MNLIKKYWWILIILFFLLSRKKKEEETEEEVQYLKIGDNSNTVGKLQDWIISNGYNIIRDSKFGTQTGGALSWILFEDEDKYNSGKNKYFKLKTSSTNVWVDWIDLKWLSKEYGFN